MATNKLNLARSQLASFLKDHEQIKQFEQLFAITDAIAPDVVNEVKIDAGSALAVANEAMDLIFKFAQYATINSNAAEQKAVQALDSLGRIANALEMLAIAPSQQSCDMNHIANACDLIETAPVFQNNNSISTDYIDLPNIGPHVTQERRIQWNQDDGTIDVGLYGGSVLQVGQEIHFYAKNTSGSTINDGTPVMFTGTIGASGKLTFGLAVADGSVLSDYMMGVTTRDIDNNDFGYITNFGLVRGIDTTGTPYGEVWSDGDLLYFDPTTPGDWTNAQPQAPNINVPVAVVINAGGGGSGSIFVRMKVSESLSKLQDVYINGTPHDLALLQYNLSNSRWESDSIVWVDVDFPIIIRSTGANIPSLTTLNGNLTMPQWAVNDYNVCESQEFIHSWKEGSTVYWHLHLTTNGLEAVAKYVRFELEYGYADVNGQWVFPAVVTTADMAIPANTPDKTMLIMSIANFTPAIKIGAHVVARLKRVASVGSAPANDPWIPILQMHIQLDTLGSRNIGTK